MITWGFRHAAVSFKEAIALLSHLPSAALILLSLLWWIGHWMSYFLFFIFRQDRFSENDYRDIFFIWHDSSFHWYLYFDSFEASLVNIEKFLFRIFRHRNIASQPRSQLYFQLVFSLPYNTTFIFSRFHLAEPAGIDNECRASFSFRWSRPVRKTAGRYIVCIVAEPCQIQYIFSLHVSLSQQPRQFLHLFYRKDTVFSFLWYFSSDIYLTQDEIASDISLSLHNYYCISPPFDRFLPSFHWDGHIFLSFLIAERGFSLIASIFSIVSCDYFISLLAVYSLAWYRCFISLHFSFLFSLYIYIYVSIYIYSFSFLRVIIFSNSSCFY